MSGILVNIPIKPYFRKYLLSKSENKQIPLKFPNGHYYNVMMHRLVTNYNSLKQIPVDDKQNVLDYFHNSIQPNQDESIAIILPFNERKDVRSYNYLSVASKKAFRREVKIDFNFEFHRFLVRNLRNGKQRLDIVNEFKELHKITEEDLKTESLYRYSTRLLESIL